MSTVHSVQFYDTHEALIDRLCGVVSSALLVGHSVLVVATKDHRELLTKSLQRLEVNVRNYAREDRFTMCDAEEMLSKFMVKDMPDPSLFLLTVGQLLMDVKKAARSKDMGLTVFGEMVAVLWDKGIRPEPSRSRVSGTIRSTRMRSTCIAPIPDPCFLRMNPEC